MAIKQRHLFVCFLCASIALLALPGWAQSLRGTVRDARTGQPVAGAAVRLLPTPTGTTTDAAGQFTLRNVANGAYTLRISSVGYRSADEAVTVNGEEPPRPTERNVALESTAIQLNQQTVITAQRREETDFARPEVTTVLTARDLRQRPPRTVPEALFGATGVFIQKTNHGGGSPFVRGLTGQQTLLLIDGIRLNNATFRSGPNQYLNTIDPQSVEQMEVLRGSGSVAYGSDAIGGVVNVLTKTLPFSERRAVTSSFFGKAATQGMEYSGRAEVGVTSSTVAVLGGLAYRHFGDLVAGRGLGRLTPTGYDQFSGDVKARVRLGQRYVATGAYQTLRQDSVPLYHRVRLDNYRLYQFHPQERQLAYARLDGFYGHRWLQSVQGTASWQRQGEGRQSQRNGSTTTVRERDQTTTTGLTLLATAMPTRHWQMQQGVEWYFDRVRSTRVDENRSAGTATTRRGLYPDGATMHSVAVFSNHTLTFDRLTLTGGARYNTFRIYTPDATFGVTTIRPSAGVGQVGASYALRPWVRAVASAGSAFRAPNIDDLGTLGIVDFRYELPNPNLRPERSFNTEIGLKVRGSRVAATLLAYHNRLTDFISRVRSGRDSLQGYPIFLKQNSAESFIRGVEAEVEYEFWSGWLAYGSLTHTYGQNVTAGEPFRRIPPFNGRVGLTYQTGRWWVRAEGLFAGAQTRLSAGDVADNRIAKGGTPGWQVLNLNAGYRTRYVTFSADAQNLTNAAYRTHGSGVDGVGRSAWLSVVVSW